MFDLIVQSFIPMSQYCVQKYLGCISPYLEFVVFGLGSAVKGSVVLKARDVIAQMELLDLLRHLVPTNRHHRRQQAEVNYRPHAANLKNKMFYCTILSF
jgi:hypothetical protein